MYPGAKKVETLTESLGKLNPDKNCVLKPVLSEKKRCLENF